MPDYLGILKRIAPCLEETKAGAVLVGSGGWEVECANLPLPIFCASELHGGMWGIWAFALMMTVENKQPTPRNDGPCCQSQGIYFDGSF